MAALTVQNMTKKGIVPTLTAASAGGDTFINDGKTFLLVENGATDVNITFVAQTTSANKPGFGDITIANTTVTVGASTQQLIGFFEPAIFNDGTGKVSVTYDDVTNVTVAVIKGPKVQI